MKTRLSRFFSHYFIPRILAYGGKILLKLLTMTCQIEVEGLEQFASKASSGNCVLMLWHNRLMLVASIFIPYAPQFIYTAFISQSRDGEPLALFTNRFKNGRTIRVKHNARHGALKEMIDRLRQTQDVLIITPDGPRGPRYEIKPGLPLAAVETSALVFPFSWSSNRFWQLKSWDKMIIPKPFAKIKVRIGTPIQLNNQQSIQEHISLLESALKLTDEECQNLFSNKPL